MVDFDRMYNYDVEVSVELSLSSGMKVVAGLYYIWENC